MQNQVRRFKSPKADKLGVIYLAPRDNWCELSETVENAPSAISEKVKGLLYSLRWQQVYDLLWIQERSAPYSGVYHKLSNFIARVGLTPFEGYRTVIDIDAELCSCYPAYKSYTVFFSGFSLFELPELKVSSQVQVGYTRHVTYWEFIANTKLPAFDCVTQYQRGIIDGRDRIRPEDQSGIQSNN